VRNVWAPHRTLGEALLAAEKAGGAGTDGKDDEDGTNTFLDGVEDTGPVDLASMY
jgi:hypothetical protein